MLLLALSASAYGQEQPTSRFGTLELKDDDDDKLNHRLLFKGKEIFRYEGQSIEILGVLKGRSIDYVIVAANSGGIACPAQAVIIELSQTGQPKISESFGSCSDSIEASLINGRVVVETPMYVPHPEFLSKRELRERERSKEVYTWYQGKLSKRIVPRGMKARPDR